MKYFVFSDIHGYYDELQRALHEEGYEVFNPDHCLIGVGDYFDRGSQSAELLEFFKSVPRKILLQGNHDRFLLNVINRGFITPYDDVNGVSATLISLTGIDPRTDPNKAPLIPHILREKGLVEFITDMPFYFKTTDYFFTHAWLPEYIPFEAARCSDWLEAISMDTIRAMTDPNQNLLNTLKNTGRQLVVGHFYTILLRRNIKDDYDEDVHSIWRHNGVIALDGCVPLSRKVNIFTFEDEPLEVLLAKQD